MTDLKQSDNNKTSNAVAAQVEPIVSCTPPNMLKRHWTWLVHYGETSMKGKACSEPEAWRLGNDAARHLKKQKTANAVLSCTGQKHSDDPNTDPGVRSNT